LIEACGSRLQTYSPAGLVNGDFVPSVGGVGGFDRHRQSWQHLPRRNFYEREWRGDHQSGSLKTISQIKLLRSPLPTHSQMKERTPDEVIGVEIRAFDPDGFVSSVDFLVDNVSLGTIVGPPYLFQLSGLAGWQSHSRSPGD